MGSTDKSTCEWNCGVNGAVEVESMGSDSFAVLAQLVERKALNLNLNRTWRSGSGGDPELQEDQEHYSTDRNLTISQIDVARMAPTRIDSQSVPTRVAKRRFLETEKKGASHHVWRRVGEKKLDNPTGQDSGPTAQVGECDFPTPAARSTNSSEKEYFMPPATQPANIREQPPFEEDEQDKRRKDKPRKLVATIPDVLLSTLRANCEVKASTSLLGRVQGKHPGLKALTVWARETLHPSLTLLSLKSNNFFEVTFANQEGRLHALKQTDLVCESAAIFFSSWRPHVHSGNTDILDYPVWVQVVNLCQILREESFLRTIGEQLGQVIDIDNSDTYKAKLYGPRMRILVQDINNLPQLIVLPRLDGEGVVEYALEYSGLPHQCGRCRSRDHQVRNCPRKDTAGGNRDQKTNQRPKKQEQAARSAPESKGSEPLLDPDNASPEEAAEDQRPKK
jgi:hypothetical protein